VSVGIVYTRKYTCDTVELRLRLLYYYYYFKTWRREIFTRKSSKSLEILVARPSQRGPCLPFAWTVMIIIIIYYNIYHYCGYYILSSLRRLWVWLSYNSRRHYLAYEWVYNVYLWTPILMMSVTKWSFIFMIIIIVYMKPWQNIIYNITRVWSTIYTYSYTIYRFSIQVIFSLDYYSFPGKARNNNLALL